MLNVRYGQFFDRQHVINAIVRAGKEKLGQAGAFIRQRAISSIRPRKRPAAPGSPPSSHTGLLRRLIYFFYDADAQSVVVGPKLSRSGVPSAPEVLEFGGRTTHWRTKKPVIYHAFPYMAPALDAERPKFPGLFTDAVHG